MSIVNELYDHQHSSDLYSRLRKLCILCSQLPGSSKDSAAILGGTGEMNDCFRDDDGSVHDDGFIHGGGFSRRR